MGLSLSELIKKVGDDNIGVQPLDQCMTNLQATKTKGNKITFATEQPFGMEGTDQMGLVLWIPRDKMAEIEKEL